MGFKVHELGQIEANREYQSRGTVGYLDALIEEWGKWPNVSHTSAATQEALETALCSASVDLREAAENLNRDLRNAKENKGIIHDCMMVMVHNIMTVCTCVHVSTCVVYLL